MQTENRRSSIKFIAIIIVLWSFAKNNFISAQDKPFSKFEAPKNTAIINFVNRGAEWKWLSKGLADMLITDLSKSSARLNIKVVKDRKNNYWVVWVETLYTEIEGTKGSMRNKKSKG